MNRVKFAGGFFLPVKEWAVYLHVTIFFSLQVNIKIHSTEQRFYVAQFQ